MYYNFEKLGVWAESRIFIKKIYILLNKLPKIENYIICDQIKRASISIALNIAEGSDKRSKKEFIRYLRISLGSINEVVTALYIVRDLEYINDTDFKSLYDYSHKLSAMINALIGKLNEK